MKSPFEIHAALAVQNQKLFGGGRAASGAQLLLFGNPIPCTHSEIVTDFELVPGGMRSETFIEQVEFLVADVGTTPVTKGTLCDLTVYPGGPVYKLRLWAGGLLSGGRLYRFMAVAANYQA